MNQLFETIFSPANAIATTLLLIIIIYWLTVIAGLIDIESFDVDIDTDVDIDVDMDLDVDADIDVDAGVHKGFDVEVSHEMPADPGTETGNATTGVGWLNKTLVFFNLGKVPFMVWLTFLILPLWFITVAVNHYLGFDSFLFGLLIFFGGVIVCFFLAKMFTWPLVKLFKKMEASKIENVDLIGCIGKVTLTIFAGRSGKVDVHTNDRHFAIYARATKNDMEITRGSQVLVIKKMEDNTETYLVEPYN